MRTLLIALSIILITAAIILGVIFMGGDSIESAISKIDTQDYKESIEMLNRLAAVSDYEKSEKIYYHRCRAINKLARQFEDEYSDELAAAVPEKKGTPDFDSAKKKLDEELTEINTETGGDLTLVLLRKQSRIIANGKFYDEFAAKYKGSGFIEDLDFTELQKLELTEPEKLLGTLSRFYKKYPNTNYIGSMVKIIFKIFKQGNINFSNQGEFLRNIIVSYGKRHPTSPELTKIYILKGDNVNLRNSPGIEGGLVGKVKKDTLLIQLEKSMDTSQIGDVRDYWYRVVDLAGLRGWIFGKFLVPFDISKVEIEEIKEAWAINDDFSEWENSNTPKNWQLVAESYKPAISFRSVNTGTIVSLNAPKGKKSGLFSRYNASKEFAILSRARYIAGESLTLVAYVFGGNKIFYIKLKDEEIEVCGTKIPLHTSDWHEYLLTSEDGKFAQLSIDGDVTAARIAPVASTVFPARGVYCLYSPQEEASAGELDYIKIR
ncbi:MAG: SH3 domain-containing protein [bacterium]|nr:SH3 domain-containing protein [bacterium]